MNPFRFGIDFIDNQMHNLVDKGIYLFYESKGFVRYSFIYHLLKYNQNFNIPCLYLTGLDLTNDNDYIRKKINGLNQFEHLTILETPMYLRSLVNDISDLNSVLRDFDVYIKTINPELVIIQNIEYFFKDEKGKSDSGFLSYLLNHFKKYEAIVIVDISNISLKGKYDYEKFTLGTFDFVNLGKNENYQLNYKSNKNSKDNLSLMFSYDSEFNITIPLYKNSYAFTLENCKFVVMIKGYEIYKEYFLEIFDHQVDFISFSSLSELFDIRIDSKHSLIFLPSYYEDFNGWAAIQKIRNKYPHSKILFTGSSYISAAQKVRAIRLGADKYLVFPCAIDDLKKTLLEMYELEEKEQQKYYIHKILRSSFDLLKGYKSKNILKKSLARFIKDYSFDMITKGISLHFFKALINTDSLDINAFVKQSKNLIFASTYFIEQKHGLLLIYKNIDSRHLSNTKNEIAQNIKTYIDLKPVDAQQVSTILRKISTLLPRKNLVVDYIHNINYPLNESDIDNILEWIYYFG
ncbi:MAG: response regulator [Candidatus Cloacimonetes bacterium]|nr:response regulator [Candidatus Cloacimonadota bacterium]